MDALETRRQERFLQYRENCFCRKLRSFLASSTNQQKLYASLEGVYERRSFNAKDDSSLKEYVYSTLYYSEGTGIPPVWNATESKDIQEFGSLENLRSSPSLSEEKLKHVEKICERIVSLSTKFKSVDEIHLYCIWIYYFDYEDDEGKATPVFKIYKYDYGNAATFLDVNLEEYYSWDSYIGETNVTCTIIQRTRRGPAYLYFSRNSVVVFKTKDNFVSLLNRENKERRPKTARFPKSFLCVPRHGKYTFVNEQLDLEFIAKTSLCRQSNNFKPFFQVAIQACLEKFRELAAVIKKKVIYIATTLLDRLRNFNFSLETLGMFAVICGMNLYDFFISPGSFKHKVGNLALMMFDTQIKGCLDFKEFVTSSVKSTLGVTSLSCPDYPPFKVLFKELVSLLRKPLKNWYEIVRVIFTLLRKSRPCLIIAEALLLNIWPFSPVILIIRGLREILDLEIFQQNTSQVKEPELAGSSPSSSVGYSHSATHSRGNEKAQKGVNNMVLRKYLQNFDLPERFPEASHQNEIVRKFGGKDCRLKNLDSSQSILLTVVDGHAVLYLPMLSLPLLNAYCQKFIGSNVHIRSVGVFDNEVVSETGEVIAKLHFLTHLSAVAILKVPENREIKLLEGLRDEIEQIEEEEINEQLCFL